MRHDLCEEALRAGHMLAELMPDEPEVLGLLALMELQASRAAARTDAAGNLSSSRTRTATRWDRTASRAAWPPRPRARDRQRAGPYQLQAAIAALPRAGGSWEATDWPRIVALYGALARPARRRRSSSSIGRWPSGCSEDRPPAWPPSTRSSRRRSAAYHLLPRRAPTSSGGSGAYARRPPSTARALALADNARERSFLAARLAACEAREGERP